VFILLVIMSKGYLVNYDSNIERYCTASYITFVIPRANSLKFSDLNVMFVE